jgi:hypothetical protein
MEVARLSALCIGRIYPPGDNLGNLTCYRLSRHQGNSAARNIKSMKIPPGPIGNGVGDILVCSAVPQPTAPPRTTFTPKTLSKFMLNYACSWSRKRGHTGTNSDVNLRKQVFLRFLTEISYGNTEGNLLKTGKSLVNMANHQGSRKILAYSILVWYFVTLTSRNSNLHVSELV